MAKKKVLKMQWFIEPGDGYTNKVIADHLLAISMLDAEFALKDIHGEDHSVYQIEPHFFATRIYLDRNNLNLSFKIFFRIGEDGRLKLKNEVRH